jgi:hypothetical protein
MSNTTWIKKELWAELDALGEEKVREGLVMGTYSIPGMAKRPLVEAGAGRAELSDPAPSALSLRWRRSGALRILVIAHFGHLISDRLRFRIRISIRAHPLPDIINRAHIVAAYTP